MPCEDYEDDSIGFGVRKRPSGLRRFVAYTRRAVGDTYESLRWLRHAASFAGAVGLLHRRRRRTD